MNDRVRKLLRQISNARPANEAEVETKILLHVFGLLGYTDADRADKCAVTMHFGREQKSKVADFILYNGAERSIETALIAVETKAIGGSLDGAEEQVKSYAVWAGTPFFIACNGEQFLAARFIPAAAEVYSLVIAVADLLVRWADVQAMLQRSAVIQAKERLSYLSLYLPQIEELPASEFLREYLSRLRARFVEFNTTDLPLVPQASKDTRLLHLPVTVQLPVGKNTTEVSDEELFHLMHDGKCRLLIVGPPGSGKSTLCARLMMRVAEAALTPGARIVPIHVRLGEGVPRSVGQALELACKQMGMRFFPSLFHTALERAKVIVILDGLDEAADASIAAAQLLSFMRTLKKGSVLMTARPLEIEPYDAVLDDGEFEISSIRELNDREVELVFRTYLGDEAAIDSLRKRVQTAGLDMLRSPLLALMAVRVAATAQDWTDLSTFDLFERYVWVLDEYFNAATVRGSQQRTPTQDIMAALSTSAEIIREARTKKETVNLEALILQARRQNRESAVVALLNAGIITSVGGRAAFIHQAFEDFGYAYYLVTALRADDPAAFARMNTSPNDLEIAHTGLQLADEVRLRSWLAHPKKRVRNRAARLLSLGCN